MVVFILVVCVAVAVSVLIHYNYLTYLTEWFPKMQGNHKFRVVPGVFGALLAHAIEIWVFALTYYLLIKGDGWGHLEGNFSGSLLDCGTIIDKYQGFFLANINEVLPPKELLKSSTRS